MNAKIRCGAISLYLLLGLIISGSAANPPENTQKILHLLNRISFGPRSGDIEQVRSRGIENYINQQLYPENIPEPQNLTQKINSLET
jgi:hypothetical protein